MELILISLLLIALTILIFFLYALSKLFSPSHNTPLPPGPTPIPIIGNLLHLLDGQPHCLFANLAKVYGPIMSLKLGLTTAIVVSSPQIAREVLQKKDAFFSARSVPDSMRAYNHHDASMFFLPSTSPLWRRNRTICATNLFSVRSLQTTREIRAQKAYDIIQFFHERAGHPICIGEIIFAGMLNIISNVLFSQDVVDINSKSRQEFKELIKESINENLKPNVSDSFPFLRFLDLQGRRQNAAHYNRRYYKFFNVIIDARLQYRSSNGKNYGDFLDSLLDLFEESKITRQEIQVLLTVIYLISFNTGYINFRYILTACHLGVLIKFHNINCILAFIKCKKFPQQEIFGAGSETTSVTVEWAMGELLHNPVAMAKAQVEVREAFALQTLAEPDIINLSYLQAVIKEVLRLHPPGPLLLHKAVEAGIDLVGYRVPKGAQVVVNAWAIGRDQHVWNEPNAFMPERFLAKQISFQERDFEFIPFGFGKKICPGLPFAVRVVPFVLALMLAEFDWMLPDGMEPKDVNVTEKFTSVLELAVPLRVVPVPVCN
ncbi:cytochrome P450 76M5-like [Carex rostrata]